MRTPIDDRPFALRIAQRLEPIDDMDDGSAVHRDACAELHLCQWLVSGDRLECPQHRRRDPQWAKRGRRLRPDASGSLVEQVPKPRRIVMLPVGLLDGVSLFSHPYR